MRVLTLTFCLLDYILWKEGTALHNDQPWKDLARAPLILVVNIFNQIGVDQNQTMALKILDFVSLKTSTIYDRDYRDAYLPTRATPYFLPTEGPGDFAFPFSQMRQASGNRNTLSA